MAWRRGDWTPRCLGSAAKNDNGCLNKLQTCGKPKVMSTHSAVCFMLFTLDIQ